MENQIINKVASSSLVTLDLEQYHQQGERVVIDIKDQLFQGQILREKDLRDFIKTHNWSQYENKFVAITCSVEAIVPTWAYMLITIAVTPYAKKVVLGSINQLNEIIFFEIMQRINWDAFIDAKVVIKGCSKISVPESAYVEVVNKLKPIASSIMFGEPCSTIPLFKRPKQG